MERGQIRFGYWIYLDLNPLNEMVSNNYAVQQEYASEGIEWDPITFTDNKHVVDIVGGKAGIFDLMSDSLSLGFSASDYRSATDRFVNCLRAKTIKDGPLQATLRLKNQFIVNHFAGQVVYTADGMLEKNTDPMPTLLFETLSSSRSEYIRQIVDYQTKDSSSKSGRKDHSKTITRQFRSQVEMLCESLKQSHIHYVKCIKPTDSKKPGDFEAAKTCEQIRCSGVLNAIEISRKSFPISREFSQFLKEFHVLVTATVKSKYPRSEQLQILKIVQEALTEKVTFHIGKTKVFMKSSDYEALKKLCLYEMGKQATVIQSRWRMMNKVRHFRLARKAVLFAQKSWRMMIQRKSYCVIKSAVQMVQIWWRYVCKRSVWRRKRKANAASKIHRWYMLCKDRSRYRQTKRAIVILQKAFRTKKLVQAAKEKQQKENLVQQNEKLRSDLLTMDQKNKMLQDQNTELQIQLEEMKLKIAAYEAELQERRESARYEGAQDLHYSCLTPISDADNEDDLSSEEVLEGSFACDVINNEETNVDDTLHGDVHKIKEEIVIQHTSCHQQDQEIQCFIEDDDGDGEGVYCEASVERVLPPDLTTFERLMMKAKEAGYDSSEEISSDSLGSSTRAVISNLFGLLHQVAVLKAELGLQ